MQRHFSLCWKSALRASADYGSPVPFEKEWIKYLLNIRWSFHRSPHFENLCIDCNSMWYTEIKWRRLIFGRILHSAIIRTSHLEDQLTIWSVERGEHILNLCNSLRWMTHRQLVFLESTMNDTNYVRSTMYTIYCNCFKSKGMCCQHYACYIENALHGVTKLLRPNRCCNSPPFNTYRRWCNETSFIPPTMVFHQI